MHMFTIWISGEEKSQWLSCVVAFEAVCVCFFFVLAHRNAMIHETETGNPQKKTAAAATEKERKKKEKKKERKNERMNEWENRPVDGTHAISLHFD